MSERPDLLPHELRALRAAALLALVIIAAVTCNQIGSFLMKRLYAIAAAAALATASLGLSGCITPSAVTGAGPTTSEASADALPVLKEVNRHLELCHRTYAWPFSVFIDCPASSPAALTADAVADLVNKAVTKAMDAYTRPEGATAQ